MKELIRKMMLLGISAFLIVVMLIVIVIWIVPAQFEDTYVAAIKLKYQNLQNKREPGIIIVGDSSAAFGIDSDLLSELTNRPVVNLGLQGGMGTEILINMTEDYCMPGDIVIYASNTKFWTNEEGVEMAKSYETIATGFDGMPELWEYIPIRDIDDALIAFPAFSFKKLDRYIAGDRKDIAQGAYSITSFDSSGKMILKRNEWCLEEVYDESWSCSLKADEISDTCINQLNSYKERIEKKGGVLLISYAPILESCVDASPNEIDAFEETLEMKLNPVLISSARDYIYPIEYLYNSPSHCNELGCEIRTRQLADDIQLYLEEKE